MKKLASKELIIGACVIVALAVLFFGIDYLKGINLFKPANFYVAKYENVAGLEVAAPITIDGYKVGQVREINFDYNKPGQIEVLLACDKQLQVPEDSKAVIASTMLSGAYIEIHLGKSRNMIPLGGAIPTDQSPDLMASLSNDIMPAVNSILPKVDSLMTNLNALTANQSLIMSMNRLDGITKNVLYATDGLNRTMNSDVPLIMNNAGRITYRIDTLVAGMGTFTNKLKYLPIDQTMAQVNSTMSNLEVTTANLKALSEQLNNPNSTLGLMMNDPELYNRLTRVAADVDSLIVDIERNPKRYISIKLF